MAMLRTPPPTDCMIWNTIIPANNTGPRIAEIQNHLVRTRSTNSRRMTAQTLCTSCHPLGRSGNRRGARRFRADQVDKDLVEGGAREVKTGQARPRADE